VRSQNSKFWKPFRIRSNESTAHPTRAHSEVSSVAVGMGAEEVVEVVELAEAEEEGVGTGVVGVQLSPVPVELSYL